MAEFRGIVWWESQAFEDMLVAVAAAELRNTNLVAKRFGEYYALVARVNLAGKKQDEVRGIDEAIQSARTLFREIAAIDKRTQGTKTLGLLTERALEANYCRVWPFCR